MITFFCHSERSEESPGQRARSLAVLKVSTTVFVVALAIRFVTLAVWLPRLNPDVNLDWYRSLARHLVAGDGFVAEDDHGRVLPQVDRTPGYPLFLAGLMRLGGDRLGWFLAVQCVVGALTCAGTSWLAGRWLTPRGSLAAGLLVALDPNLVLRCLDLRTETLFTLVLVAGAGLVAWRADRPWAWLATGAFWSYATLTRPIAIGLWVVGTVVVLGTTAAPVRRRIGCLVALWLGFLSLISLWSARNYALTGRWFFSTAPTFNLLVGRAAAVAAQQHGQNADRLSEIFATEFRGAEFFESREQFAIQWRACRAQALRLLAEAPSVAVRQYALGWGQMLLGPGAQALEHSRRTPAKPARGWPVVYAVVLGITSILGVIGVWRLGRSGMLLTALVVYFIMLSGGAGGNSRFRVPITPLLAVLVVASWPTTRQPE